MQGYFNGFDGYFIFMTVFIYNRQIRGYSITGDEYSIPKTFLPQAGRDSPSRTGGPRGRRSGGRSESRCL